MDYESLVIPSFTDLYRFHSGNKSSIITDWLSKELQLILANKGIKEDEHNDIKAIWADESQPVLDRLNAVRTYFKSVSAQLESAHAEAYVQQRRLVHGSETFRNVHMIYCDEYNGGDWYDHNYWHLINDATCGAGDTEKAAMDAAGDERWTYASACMTYLINPNCPWPIGTCDRGRAKAAQILEEFIYNQIFSEVRRLCCEAKRLIKYGH